MPNSGQLPDSLLVNYCAFKMWVFESIYTHPLFLDCRESICTKISGLNLYYHFSISVHFV